jgi:hypothetical protein
MNRALGSRAFVVSMRFIVLATLCVVGWIAIQSGVALRVWAWNYTDPIHFYPDMGNGVFWGSQGNQPENRPRGFLNVYDFVASSADKREDDSPEYGLDYAPLRLLLITRWQAWAARTYPPMMAKAQRFAAFHREAAWHPPYGFYKPLLQFNQVTELLAAMGLFLLTRHWVLRGDRRWGSANRAGAIGAIYRPFRGSGAGAVAALLFWFNPAVIVSAHGWPTWDEWIIPFFIWTVWLCCVDWWFAAGLVLAAGAMFKGQQLFVAPMFVLWPLLLGRPIAALRWIAGLAIGIALLATPWLLSYVPGGVTGTSVFPDRQIDRPGVCFLCVIIFLVATPLLSKLWTRYRKPKDDARQEKTESRRRLAWAKISPFARLLYGPLAALAVAIALFLCSDLFHGSLNWLYIGWGYGTRHYMNMVTGKSDNLAGLLSQRFGWYNLTDLFYTIGAHPIRLWPLHFTLMEQPTPITIRTLLITIYLITFILSVIGMAIQFRRNDPRFLVGMTATWLMFFAFLPQIHERYLLYAAGAGCSLAAVGTGFVLLDVFLTALTVIMPLHVMLLVADGNGQIRHFAREISPTFGRTLFSVIDKTYPDAGWALLLCAGIFLYHSFAPTPSSRRNDSADPEPSQ